MIAAHYAVVRARLDAEVGLNGKGSDAVRTNADGSPVSATYWVLFGGGPDDLDDRRLASVQSAASDAEFSYTVRLVSPTVAGVLAMLDKVSSQCAGWTPAVSGRLCSAAEVDLGDVEVDTRVTPPLFFADVDIEFTSSRAA